MPERTVDEYLDSIEATIVELEVRLERIAAAVERLLPPPGKPGPGPVERRHLRLVADERKAA